MKTTDYLEIIKKMQTVNFRGKSFHDSFTCQTGGKRPSPHDEQRRIVPLAGRGSNQSSQRVRLSSDLHHHLPGCPILGQRLAAIRRRRHAQNRFRGPSAIRILRFWKVISQSCFRNVALSYQTRRGRKVRIMRSIDGSVITSQ